MRNESLIQQLRSYCQRNDWEGAYSTLYSEKVISIDPYPTPIAEIETVGLEALRKKAQRFDAKVEIENIILSEPITAGNNVAFSITMKIKGANGIDTFNELAVYKIDSGKIVQERFFYD